MGNQSSSPAPCFDDQIYTTLSWGDDKAGCRQLWDDSCSTISNHPRVNSPKRAELPLHHSASPRIVHSESSQVSLTAGSITADPYDDLPALTDNVSSSEPSSPRDGGHDHFRAAARREMEEPTRNTQQPPQVNVITLHDHGPCISPSRSAEYYLGMVASSSNDYTHGTSGSLERDARADLGTSRGSSVQGREGFDELDESRTDVSERFHFRGE